MNNLLGHNNFDITDNTMFTRHDLLKRIGTLIASSVFEQYYLGEYSTSCSNDFKNIDEIFNLLESCHMFPSYHPTKKEKIAFRNEIISILQKKISVFITNNPSLIQDFYDELDTKETLHQESINNLLSRRAIAGGIYISSLDFLSINHNS